MEIFEVHPQAGARCGLQVHAAQAGYQSNFHHRARRRLSHRQADGGHHRERGRILLRKSCRRGQAGDAGSRLPGFLGLHLRPLRLPEGAGPGRGQETPEAGAGPARRRRGATHLPVGLAGNQHPGHHQDPEPGRSRRPPTGTLDQDHHPPDSHQRDLYGNLGLGHEGQGQRASGAGGGRLPSHRLQGRI